MPDDAVLTARVRAQIGHMISDEHPHNFQGRIHMGLKKMAAMRGKNLHSHATLLLDNQTVAHLPDPLNVARNLHGSLGLCGAVHKTA